MPSHAYSRSLAATALAYVVLHHLGLLPSGLGTAPDDTQWADWLDLAVPLLVLGPAALTLWAAQPATRTWALFGVGVVTYASGHGLHLSANSIGNADPGPTAHLWDEVVGHHVWYLGVALVIAALSDTMTGRPRPGPVGYLLAVAAGLTWASNAVGGGTVVMSVLLAVVAAAYGFTRRRELGWCCSWERRLLSPSWSSSSRAAPPDGSGLPSGGVLSHTVPVTWPRFRRRPVSGSHDECTPASSTVPAPLEEEQLAQARERWSSWYAAQDNVLAPGTGCPLSCPCCGHPTLAERGADERCSECGWYDDGQDDHDSDVVRGGPNGCLSLDAARLRYVAGGGTPLPRHPRADPA